MKRPGRRSRSTVRLKAKCRHALDLIQRGARRQFGDQPRWIGGRRGPSHIVVEGDVVVAERTANCASERGLAALPGSVDQRDRRIGERFAQRCFRESRIIFDNIHRLIISLGSG